ncbi:NlpC/P60 family protein [Arthrobacter caoxuetaonis]|uniref:C40 family peptidase n=1 Tax=Arthrobacter caoxuetaonis TaxID=2886935 RepID=A0A9X1MGV2_9MICC|nr:NlpC/P60 family protein [Arthrobacter caoxuetaonis]MCC3299571.1 C40 family peptidase [Arthrobacter caoxuetaonis]USQ57817.1 C40 family peptidase [Arthrobacter caoxuetaonis]
MSSNTSGRHRAPAVQTSPLTALSKAVTANAGSVGRQAAVVVAASGLVLAAGMPAQAAPVSTDRQALESTPLNVVTSNGTVTVSEQAPFELPVEPLAGSLSGAEIRAEIAAAELAAAEEAAAALAAQQEAYAAQQAAAAPAAAAQASTGLTTASSAPVAEVSASGVAAGLVASAYSQIGVAQDCTAMVEKALRSVGKSVGDLGPSQFFAFGAVVGTPQAGDLVITGGHVAIYVGNGQVISGGLNGMNTGLHSLSDLPGASFVRVS